MPRSYRHAEAHLVSRIGWLRAAVLGANDGLVSTASLIVGVAAASAKPSEVLVAGAAALAAGAMSMAAGEYVSVSSQADTEKADIARETQELKNDGEAEHAELAQIYVERGLEPETARIVAQQLMAKDALDAHARDELGISLATAARPVQAALASAASFTVGAAAPLIVVAVAPVPMMAPGVVMVTLACLVLLGVAGAKAGGAPPWRAAARVTFWGALAMIVTAGIGRLVGTVI
ncbi:MAG: VIT family protein [Gemmatimonadaceae bacterium]|nr:VIT family protein [Caulobacter sp.]